MSSLLHSDPEDSSDESSADSLAAQEMEAPTEEKVPVSTSIIFSKTQAQLKVKSVYPAKVAIRLSAIGSTPAISPSSFTVAETQTVATISKFLMKKLNLKTIYMYVSNSFQPTPDERIGQLHEIFSTGGVLNFSYCENIAFG
ncbi:hypothetical protein JCM33374_g5461 [Metschnikowia sp. JCM 33374]|nr:hypothetical protein JCM33374_g5461 [Metschnikowia sp. JCM 33374]